MNGATDIFTSAWQHALGWTLLNSFWEAGLAAALTAAALRLIPSKQSGLRYVVACSGLLFFILSTIVTFSVVYDLAVLEDNGVHDRVLFPPASLASTQPASANPVTSIQIFLNQHMESIVLLWALGFLLFSARFGAGIFYTHRLRSKANPISDKNWVAFVATCARHMGITRNINIAESPLINTPMVLGFLKPLVLIPVGMMSGLSTEQLETILVHELAHIKRRDYIINLLQTFLEAIFFFNPFVWVISKHIRREREYCCDDLVVKKFGGAMVYAHALVNLAEARLASPALALPLANNTNQLLMRIKRLMDKSDNHRTVKSQIAIGLFALMGCLIVTSWIKLDSQLLNQITNSTNLQDIEASIINNTREGVRHSTEPVKNIDENTKPYNGKAEYFVGNNALRLFIEEQVALSEVSPLVPLSKHFLPGTPGLHTNQQVPLAFNDEEFQRIHEVFEQHFNEFFSGADDYSPNQFVEEFIAFQSDDWQAQRLNSGEHFWPLAYIESIETANEMLHAQLEEFDSHHPTDLGLTSRHVIVIRIL